MRIITTLFKKKSGRPRDRAHKNTTGLTSKKARKDAEKRDSRYRHEQADLKGVKIQTRESRSFLDELDLRLQKIEDAVENLANKPVVYNFNIEKLDIHDPTLKELSFTLEKLDVKDLSGALNLGNNIGVSVGSKDKAKDKEQKPASQHT